MTEFQLEQEINSLKRKIRDLEDEIKKVREIAERALRKAKNL